MAVTARDLVGFLTGTNDLGGCWPSTRAGNFDKVREMVVAVSLDDSERDFLWKSALRALDSSLSIRELQAFLWSSRGTERESSFDELGRVWERVI